MDKAALEAEKRLTYESDKLAFDRLTTDQQLSATRIANASYTSRTAAIFLTRGVIGLTSIVFDICFLLPYRLAGKAVRLTADLAVRGAGWSVSGVSGAGRGGLAVGRGSLWTGTGAILLLGKLNLLSEETSKRWQEKFAAGRQRLYDMRDSLIAWSQSVRKNVEDSYSAFKTGLQNIAQKSYEFAEYYGAIGLYRGTRWLLDPRTKTGKPLLGSERLNKIAGSAVAAVSFVALAATLLHLGFMAKVWHLKLAHSLFTDTAGPMYLNILKQAPLHLLITGGVTGLKFFGLPPLAATRRALKSHDYPRGIAYQYNTSLQNALKEKAPNPSADSRKVFSNIIEKFIEHIVVEKAAPEFYESRLKYYQGKAKNAFNATAPQPVKKPKPPSPPSPPVAFH